MRIPEVREELKRLADEHGIPRLRELAEELYRRPAAKRALPRARMMTDELRQRIREYVATHPTMSNRDVGRHFGVDGGRVSEAVNGFRE